MLPAQMKSTTLYSSTFETSIHAGVPGDIRLGGPRVTPDEVSAAGYGPQGDLLPGKTHDQSVCPECLFALLFCFPCRTRATCGWPADLS